jgi:hypothetical protein
MRPLLLSVLALALPRAAAAQTAVVVPAPAAVDQPPRWSFTLGVEEDWDSRPQLGAVGSGRFATQLSADLAHTRRGRRGTLTLGAWGSGWLYEGGEEVQLTYQGSLSGGLRVGPRLWLTAQEAFRTDYTDEDPSLLEEGTVLPRVVMRTNNAQAGLSFALSKRTELTASVRHEMTDFDTPLLIGRSSLGVQGGLYRQVTRSGRAWLDYLGELRTASGETGGSHRAAVGWQQGREGRSGGSAAVGAQLLERLDTGQTHVEPYGSAGVWWRGRAGSLTLRYEHGVTLSYRVLSEQASDMASLSASRSLGGGVNASVYTSYSIRQNLNEAGAEDTHMQRYGAALGFDGGKGLTASVDYSYYRYAEDEVGPRQGRHRVGASLQYGRRWR